MLDVSSLRLLLLPCHMSRKNVFSAIFFILEDSFSTKRRSFNNFSKIALCFSCFLDTMQWHDAVANQCARFHQNWMQIVAVGVPTDRCKWSYSLSHAMLRKRDTWKSPSKQCSIAAACGTGTGWNKQACCHSTFCDITDMARPAKNIWQSAKFCSHVIK